MNYLESAEGYYNAILAKDFNKVASYLHDDIQIFIRSRFSLHNQVMFAYDFMFPAPIEKLRSAVFMEFTDNLISKIELFYDGRSFDNSIPKKVEK